MARVAVAWVAVASVAAETDVEAMAMLRVAAAEH